MRAGRSITTRPPGRVAPGKLAHAVRSEDDDTDVALASGEVVQVGCGQGAGPIQIAQQTRRLQESIGERSFSVFGDSVLRAGGSGNCGVQGGSLRTNNRLKFLRDGAVVQPPERGERGAEE
jgi:hypothetical protein